MGRRILVLVGTSFASRGRATVNSLLSNGSDGGQDGIGVIETESNDVVTALPIAGIAKHLIPIFRARGCLHKTVDGVVLGLSKSHSVGVIEKASSIDAVIVHDKTGDADFLAELDNVGGG